MSIPVFCPLGHAVTPDDLARPDAVCPRCGTPLPGGGPPPPGMAARPGRRPSRDEDEDEEDVEDRPRKRRPPPVEEEEDDEPEDDAPKLTRKQRQLSKVRLGILFHIFKLWTYLAAMLFGFIAMPLILFAAAVGAGWIGTILTQLTFNLSMTLAPIFGTVGSILCAWAPPRSEARGTIIVSLVFDLLAPFFGILQLIMVIGFVVTVDDRIERLSSYMYYARIACTVTAWWLFQLYLRKLSFYMRESLLASECLNVIVHLLIATIIGPTLVTATFIVALFFGGCITVILFFATLGWLIYFVVTFPVRQFRLLFLVRAKIYQKFLKTDDDD